MNRIDIVERIARNQRGNHARRDRSFILEQDDLEARELWRKKRLPNICNF